MKSKSKGERVEIYTAIVSIIILVWIGASYIDVVSNNLSSYSYQWWNCFKLF